MNASQLRLDVIVRLVIFLPAPFTKVPRPLVTGASLAPKNNSLPRNFVVVVGSDGLIKALVVFVGAVGLIMRSVMELIVPKFVDLLESDYRRWLNGTRDVVIPVGELLADSNLSEAKLGSPDIRTEQFTVSSQE